jgi:hypothetical protein
MWASIERSAGHGPLPLQSPEEKRQKELKLGTKPKVYKIRIQPKVEQLTII